MKLYATVKNERGGKKSTADDTRLLVELSYKNKVIGEIGLYSITDNGLDLGYRVIWRSPKTEGNGLGYIVLEEEKTGEKQKSNSIKCPLCDDVATYRLQNGVHEWVCASCPFIGREEY